VRLLAGEEDALRLILRDVPDLECLLIDVSGVISAKGQGGSDLRNRQWLAGRCESLQLPAEQMVCDAWSGEDKHGGDHDEAAEDTLRPAPQVPQAAG
jgi:hypothetical protein